MNQPYRTAAPVPPTKKWNEDPTAEEIRLYDEIVLRYVRSDRGTSQDVAAWAHGIADDVLTKRRQLLGRVVYQNDE